MSNNEQEHPDIDIAFISTDEVQAWKRPIRLRFKGNEAQVNLYWDEQDGYSAIVKKFFEGWSADEQAEFLRWTRDQESLGLLEDLTAWKRPNTEEDDSETEYQEQIDFDKLSLFRDQEIEGDLDINNDDGQETTV
jgi:hypothetical protein